MTTAETLLRARDRCDAELIEWHAARRFLADLVAEYDADIAETERRRVELNDRWLTIVRSEARRKVKR